MVLLVLRARLVLLVRLLLSRAPQGRLALRVLLGRLAPRAQRQPSLDPLALRAILVQPGR